MIAIAVGLILLGFFLISLSMKRHFKQLYPQKKMASLRQLFIFRVCGYAALLLAMSLFIAVQGLGYGLVVYLGLLTLVALLQSLLLTYKPQWLTSIGLVCFISSICYTSII
ncbi:MAG: DUF3325 domain-containing protein [Gammaproteobacteria bacterium]|nr:DUF3325 domain-containing protein [Gammaproteobacteria bacterium]